MIKGCQRKVMHLKRAKSRYFDEAYLIMKDDIINDDEEEILKEAERLIFEGEGCKRQKRGGLGKKIFGYLTLGFGVGFFIGFALAFVVALITL